MDSYKFDGNYLTWTTDGANAGRVFARYGRFNCTNVCGLLVEREHTKGYANKYMAEALNRVTPGYVSYVGNPKLMNNVMSEVVVQIPSLDEQKRIADFLSTFDKKIEVEKTIWKSSKI
jgi:type I restriction enzyme S subunit